MARKTKEEKRIDAAVDTAFNTHASGIQFNIMDLGKIHDAGAKAAPRIEDIDAAVIAAIQLYRVN